MASISNERIKRARHTPEIPAKLGLLDSHIVEILLVSGLEASRSSVGPGQRQEPVMILSQLGYLQLRSIDIADDDCGKLFIVIHPWIAAMFGTSWKCCISTSSAHVGPADFRPLSRCNLWLQCGPPAANGTSELRQDADGLCKWNGGTADAAVLHQKIEV